MAPKSGRGTANVLRGQMGTATYMRADDTTLYFTDATNGIVGRVSLADRKTTVLARDQNHPSSLDVDAEHVFFTSGGKLMSVSKDAAGPV
jgi:sugar lactone lactonase YvrE